MKHLRRLRKKRGLSQLQLAEAVGCTQGTVSKMERGEFNATLDLIERVAKVLRVEPVELFGLSELEQRFLDALRHADLARQQAVLLLLEGNPGPRQAQDPRQAPETQENE